MDTNQTNKDEKNEFILASRDGHLETVKLLIEKGIDINQTDEEYRQNALHWASNV